MHFNEQHPNVLGLYLKFKSDNSCKDTDIICFAKKAAQAYDLYRICQSMKALQECFQRESTTTLVLAVSEVPLQRQCGRNQEGCGKGNDGIQLREYSEDHCVAEDVMA